MSNALAIATVTTALAQIVRAAAQEAVSGADVVTGRPEAAGNGPSLQKVHLYLYQVSPNAALRNADLPTRGADGKLTQRARVALDLYYLLIFYGNENELEPQRMLGAVVRDLHARPLLSRQMVKDAVASQPFLANSNLADAVETVKFSPAVLTLEELSKLWSVFLQTPHALSVAYQGAVVLIEGEDNASPAPPVLRRGQDDSGIDTAIGPFPSVEHLHVGDPQDAGLQPRPPSYPSAQQRDQDGRAPRKQGRMQVRTALEHWQQGNDDYLAAALAWLRLRLQRRAGSVSTPVVVPTLPDAPVQPASRWCFRRRPVADLRIPALPPPSGNVTDEQIAQAAEAMRAAEDMEPPPALLMLSQRFELSGFERETLLLCTAIELDTRIATLCTYAHNDPHRAYPTFALALALFDDPAWDALSPQRPLRYWRLIEINQPGAQPLTTSALRADERIVNYLKGLNYLDDRLAPLLLPLSITDGEVVLPPSQQTVIEGIVRRLHQSAGVSSLPVIHLIGPDAPSKQLVAWHAAAALGLRLYRLPVELLPTQAAELETLARLWQRESLLLPVALYLDGHELEKSTDGPTSALSRFLARSGGVLFLDTRDVGPGGGQASLVYDVTKPTPAERQTAWTAALTQAAAHTPGRLAAQFNLSLATIRHTAQTVLAETPTNEDAATLHHRLWDACLLHTRPRLDTLAQRLDPKATWKALVLPEPELKLLHQIAAQVGQRNKVYDEWGFRRTMNRGLGISALFAGESSTGKTMAAEVIANDLRLNLYRIDLSQVVSKYIGETEKNLRRLFDAAEDGGAILFFDEADALFGKRSEVKDSHDRYANIEINYLLQRIEAYRGLAILATNMKSALDQAFLRRLRFIVTFPFPGPVQRQAIWQKVFPPETQTTGLDCERLGRLNLTGGSIHNIALNAAFLAVQEGMPITMEVILAAARTEFRKLEKPINEADFRWAEPTGVAA